MYLNWEGSQIVFVQFSFSLLKFDFFSNFDFEFVQFQIVIEYENEIKNEIENENKFKYEIENGIVNKEIENEIKTEM